MTHNESKETQTKRITYNTASTRVMSKVHTQCQSMLREMLSQQARQKGKDWIPNSSGSAINHQTKYIAAT